MSSMSGVKDLVEMKANKAPARLAKQAAMHFTLLGNNSLSTALGTFMKPTKKKI